MKKIYFVFDQIPSAQSGGLIGMYLNICEKLKYDYDINIVSIYNCDEDNLKLFKDYNIIITNKFNIDNRFFKVIQYLKNKQIKKVFKAIVSVIIFFLYIPICRYKMAKMFRDEKRIVVTSPAAGIFMSKKNKFQFVKLTLEDIFKDYDGEYVSEEFDWGSPVGKEVW